MEICCFLFRSLSSRRGIVWYSPRCFSPGRQAISFSLVAAPTLDENDISHASMISAIRRRREVINVNQTSCEKHSAVFWYYQITIPINDIFRWKLLRHRIIVWNILHAIFQSGKRICAPREDGLPRYSQPHRTKALLCYDLRFIRLEFPSWQTIREFRDTVEQLKLLERSCPSTLLSVHFPSLWDADDACNGYAATSAAGSYMVAQNVSIASGFCEQRFACPLFRSRVSYVTARHRSLRYCSTQPVVITPSYFSIISFVASTMPKIGQRGTRTHGYLCFITAKTRRQAA